MRYGALALTGALLPPVERHVTSADTVFAWYRGCYAVKGRASACKQAGEVATRYATPFMRFLGDRWERLGRTQAGERALTQFLGRALAEAYDVAVYVRRDSSKAGDR